LSPLILENLINTNFKEVKNLELGEVYLNARSGIKLPLGILARFNNIKK
jgi:23S rRNA (cytosine1962-C5)-methyltransferase